MQFKNIIAKTTRKKNIFAVNKNFALHNSMYSLSHYIATVY